jgi:uncharacterized protein
VRLEGQFNRAGLSLPQQVHANSYWASGVMTHRTHDPLPKLLAWAALLAFLLLIGASCGGQTGGTPDGNPDEGNGGDTQGPADVRGTSGGSEGKKVGRLVDDLSGEQIDVAPESDNPPESDVALTASADQYDPQLAQAMADYLDAVVQNNDIFWTQYFRDSGFREPMVSYAIVMPGETYTSKCPDFGGGQLTVVHDTPNAFYCPLDEPNRGYLGTIILPVTTMTKTWTGDIFGKPSQQAGDFATAIITAHEFGHHMVDEMRVQFSQREGSEIPAPTWKYNELIADCMAGVWAADAYATGVIDEQNDMKEAVAALQAIGDHDYVSEGHHGTPEERAEALITGYKGIQGVTQPGDPVACIRTYWVTSS